MINSVAIIGAGASGLVAAKEALECGLSPTIFEQEKTLGGNWRPDGKPWNTMQINNSRFATSFSDFEWPEEADHFPKAEAIYQYLSSYAKTHHLEIRFEHKITRIARKGEGWQVEWLYQGEINVAYFDAVIICSGVNVRPFIPEIPGLGTLGDHYTHAQNYQAPEAYAGKCVVVVGNAFSGCEIAAEIAKKAKAVVHLFNRKKWIMTRYMKEQHSERTVPFDLLYNRDNANQYRGLSLPEIYQKTHHFYKTICQKQSEVKDLADPAEVSQPQYISISDIYTQYVQEGKITVKQANIESIKEGKLYLSDQSCLVADHLLFGTGYRLEIPFFDAMMLEQLDFQEDEPIAPIDLYKTVFHPKFANMAFVGLCRFPIHFGIAELQARWACMVFSGKLPWPTQSEMEEEIKNTKQNREVSPRPQFFHPYIRMCDELAKQIKVLPDFAKLQIEDPELYHKLWFGPFTTASFRLVGFGSKPQLALKTIDKLSHLVGKPFQDYECVYGKSINQSIAKNTL